MSETVEGSIRIALENAVLCRGTHGAKESYEYAKKMEAYVKSTLKRKLEKILDSFSPEDEIKKLIKTLET